MSTIDPELRAALEAHGDAPLIRHLAAVPKDVREELTRLVGKLAADGEKYQATDFVVDADLPSRRFTWAWRAGERRFLVGLDHGGFAKHVDVVVLLQTGSVWSLAWAGECDVDERALVDHKALAVILLDDGSCFHGGSDDGTELKNPAQSRSGR